MYIPSQSKKVNTNSSSMTLKKIDELKLHIHDYLYDNCLENKYKILENEYSLEDGYHVIFEKPIDYRQLQVMAIRACKLRACYKITDHIFRLCDH